MTDVVTHLKIAKSNCNAHDFCWKKLRYDFNYYFHFEKYACHTSITQLKRSRLSETIILIAIKLAKKVSLTFVSIVKS